ncbi:unnamed protein product [Durusdinium trenchii]|uniref:Dynein heavy chain coiled coil stalk domain-containing protein n=1 Tax=Durusdinium trenchii TaxID=1381693 RepID=A0ABP0HDY2_9DINO
MHMPGTHILWMERVIRLTEVLQPRMRRCNEEATGRRQRCGDLQEAIEHLGEARAKAAEEVGGLSKRQLSEIRRLLRSPPEPVKRTLAACWLLLHCQRFKDKPSAVRFDEKTDWPRCQRMLVDEVPSVPACVAQSLGIADAGAPKVRPALRRSATVPVKPQPPLDIAAVLRASEPCGPLLHWVQALIVEHTERIKLQAELTEAVAARTKAESSEAEAEADLAEAEALLGRLREALASQEAALEQLAAEKMAAEKALRDIRRLDSIAVPTKAPKVSESPKASPEKKAEKIPIPIELTFFVMQSFQEPPRRSTLGAPRKGWADKDWNWGSPFGTAHDEAMALRERLDTREQRETWLKRLESGQVDVEEMKLALGLRIQHAARQGLDGDGAGWALMQDMAACKYEGSDGQKLLKEDLDQLTKVITGTSSSSSVESSGASALMSMRFLEGGL